jgi:mannose/fructose/N-acetylgalactosamine-specific phosphotransferase system component IIC
VAATITGALCGAPEIGLIIGAILEMLAMETMPFGASRYLEWSSGSVAATVFATGEGRISEPALLVGVLIALATAWLAGSSMVVLRRINGALVSGRRARLENGDATSLLFLQVMGILLDFIRGAMVVLVAVLVALPVGRWLMEAIGGSTRLNAAVIVALPTAVAIAAAWRMFASGTRRRILVLAGASIGVAIVVAR